MAFIGKLDALLLFVYNKIEVVSYDMHMLVVILHVIIFRIEQQLLDTRLAEIFYKRIVPRKSLVRPQKYFAALLFVAGSNQRLCLVEQFCDICTLQIIESLYIWFILRELLVIPLGYRTGNDKRGSRIMIRTESTSSTIA